MLFNLPTRLERKLDESEMFPWAKREINKDVLTKMATERAVILRIRKIQLKFLIIWKEALEAGT